MTLNQILGIDKYFSQKHSLSFHSVVSLSKLERASWNILSDFKMENFGNIESKIGKYLHYQGD